LPRVGVTHHLALRSPDFPRYFRNAVIQATLLVVSLSQFRGLKNSLFRLNERLPQIDRRHLQALTQELEQNIQPFLLAILS